MRRLALAAAVALTVAVVVPAPAQSAAAGPVVTTLPGGLVAGYAPPAVVVQKGGALTYANADVASHDVISFDYGPDTEPWCGSFLPGECPLIWSELIPLGNTTPVRGLDNVTPGAAYRFYCSLHPNMVGTLVVAPA